MRKSNCKEKDNMYLPQSSSLGPGKLIFSVNGVSCGIAVLIPRDPTTDSSALFGRFESQLESAHHPSCTRTSRTSKLLSLLWEALVTRHARMHQFVAVRIPSLHPNVSCLRSAL